VSERGRAAHTAHHDQDGPAGAAFVPAAAADVALVADIAPAAAVGAAAAAAPEAAIAVDTVAADAFVRVAVVVAAAAAAAAAAAVHLVVLAAGAIGVLDGAQFAVAAEDECNLHARCPLHLYLQVST